MSYTDLSQEESKNQDFVITKKEQFALQSEHLSSLCYNSHTKMLRFEFDSGSTLDINIRSIDTLRMEK